MPSGSAILETDRLSKQFGSLYALRSTSVSLETGQFLTIYGRNGAGKTTFLKIISTLIRTYQGRVALFGGDVKSAGRDVRRRIGFVSHESFLYSDLTVVDNLVFYGKLYGLADPQAEAEKMIERMELGVKKLTPARALSRGMKQRLALGRAFIHKPDLLILDEPFTGLDERSADTLHGLLEEFKNDGGSAVMATHDAERGWRHADRVIVLERGACVYQSTTDETTYEEFHKRYRDILAV